VALTVRNAILHILNNDNRPSVFSEAELDIDSEICEMFIQKHVRKLLNNPAVRTAVFKPESEMYSLLGEYQNGLKYFKDVALVLASRMDEIMNRFPSIPSCDMLIARVGHKSGEYLAVLQLHYQEVYVHKMGNADNQLVIQNALPYTTGKVEFACLIGLDGASMPISLLEKPVGEVLYFSELFLECDSTPSKKEQVQLIDEVTVEFVEEHFASDPAISARIKTAIVTEAESDDGYISMDNVATQAFEQQEDMKAQYVNTLRDAGVREDLPLTQRVIKQQFSTQRIKAENGVDIRFPAQMIEDEELELTTHPDGTVTIVFKNLRMV